MDEGRPIQYDYHMNLQEIVHLRLVSQQIAGTKFTSVKELVAWMGAMQAQDTLMVKWAVGVRLPNATEKDVEAALDRGEILRTHVLRPTWHIVSADDLRWMLSLTAPRIQAGMKSRHSELGLDAGTLSKSRKVIEKTLRSENHAPRETLIRALEQAGIATDENRASHLFAAAELEGLICSGKTQQGKQTFALLEEWVPPSPPIERDEALARLAKRYFTSHGPATLEDFTWWSGLAVSDARRALDMAKAELRSEAVGEKTYWFAAAKVQPKETAFLLPAFDEFLISYKDRSATITLEHQKRAFTSNGVFHPVIVVNGRAVGVWKRTLKRDQAQIQAEYFVPITPAAQRQIEAEAVRYGVFLGKIPFLSIKE